MDQRKYGYIGNNVCRFWKIFKFSNGPRFLSALHDPTRLSALAVTLSLYTTGLLKKLKRLEGKKDTECPEKIDRNF